MVGLFLFHPVLDRLFRATARSDSSLGMYFRYRTTFGLRGDAMSVHGEHAPCWVLASLPSGICLYKARHVCPPGTIASKIVSRLVPSVTAAVVYPVPYLSLYRALCPQRVSHPSLLPKPIPFDCFHLSGYKSLSKS